MFLPWRGLIEQAAACDVLVFYDDVQLPLGGGRGRGFLTRVQIKALNGPAWLSLPVDRAGKGRQLIRDAVIAGDDWRAQHLGRIQQAYGQAPFFKWTMDNVVMPVYRTDTASLCDLCVHSMRALFAALGLAPRSLASSTLDLDADVGPSERVLAVCRAMGATDYLTGLGAMNYIDYDLFEAAGVRIHYMDYDLAPYSQLHGDFNPFVSAIDLLFNRGPAAREELRPRSVYWKEWPRWHAGRPSR
jgi:hypothetical protein